MREIIILHKPNFGEKDCLSSVSELFLNTNKINFFESDESYQYKEDLKELRNKFKPCIIANHPTIIRFEDGSEIRVVEPCKEVKYLMERS